MIKIVNRRRFLQSAAAGIALMPAELWSRAGHKVRIGIFSKHLQWLDYQQTAETVAELGYDGIECPVRPRGHVLPENAGRDLPRFAGALRSHGRDILMATTAFHDLAEAHAKTILRTAAQLGIKLYRIGGWRYSEGVPVPDRLIQIRAQLEAFVEFNREHGICAAYQNHSGTRVGAAVWDIWELIRDFDPEAIGIAFDIGHATVEGGYAWPVHFRLMRPHIKIVIVKDFKWGRDREGRWRAMWCPLGQGMVDRSFFNMLAESGYSGPIIQHFEYPVQGGNEREKQDNLIAAMKRDLLTLKGWLEEAGLL